MFDLDECLIFLTNRRSKILSTELERRLVPYKITKIQWMALYYLHKHSEMTQKALAEALYIKEPSLVRMVDKLEREGYIARVGSQSDRRVKYLVLTDTGLNLYSETLPLVEHYKKDMTDGLSPEEEDIVKRALVIMEQNALSSK